MVMPAVLAIGLGLFLWLGGARYAGIVLGCFAAAVGAITGYHASSWLDTKPLWTTIIAAVGCTIIAVILKRAVIILLAVVIFATAAGSTYLNFSLPELDLKSAPQDDYENYGETTPGVTEETDGLDYQSDYSAQADRQIPPDASSIAEMAISPDEKHKIAIEKIKDLFERLRQTISEKRSSLILWTALGAAVGLLLAYVLQKIIMALCCSIVGATTTIAGTLAIIMAKQHPVISSLQDRPKVFPIIFITMIVFGWLVQLLLTKPAKEKTPQKDEKDKDKEK